MNKKFNKLIKSGSVAILSGLMVCSLAACGGNNDEIPSAVPSQTENQKPVAPDNGKDELTRIEVTKLPNKVKYNEDDQFDPTGMEVKAIYVNSKTHKKTSKVVTDYKFDFEEGYKLKLEDKNVKVIWNNQFALIPITVQPKRAEFDIAISKVGEYRVEAENIPDLLWVAKPGREGMFYEDANGLPASGNKFVGSLGQGTIFNVNFKLEAKQVVELYGMFAEAGADYSLTDSCDFYLDGEAITPEVVKYGGIEGNKYANWKKNGLGKYLLDAGMHELKFVVKEGNAGPQVDYIGINVFEYDGTDKILASISIENAPDKLFYAAGEKLDLTGLKVMAKYLDGTSEEIKNYTISKNDELALTDNSFEISYKETKVIQKIAVMDANKLAKNGSYRIEAENLNKAFAAGENKYTTEASYNRYVSGLTKGSELGYIFDNEVESNMALSIRLATTTDYKINENLKLTLDGKPLSINDAAITKASLEWSEILFNTETVKAGRHLLGIEVIGDGCDIDCLTADLVATGENRELSKIEVTTKPTKTYYNLNSKFDRTGMVVTAYYSDGTSEEVTDYYINKSGELQAVDNEIIVTYLGKTAKTPIEVSERQVIDTPTKPNDLFKINGNYVEIDRSGSTMFTMATKYVVCYIYGSSDADKTKALGSFKIVIDAKPYLNGVNVGNIVSNDESIKISIHGAPNNYFRDYKDCSGQLLDLFKHELGDEFAKHTEYYLAFQVIAETNEVEGVLYADSAISDIATNPVLKVAAAPEENK